MNARLLACAALLAAAVPAQNQNAVFRHNRAFYTSMWTANPPEYTTIGQTVPAGTMHWRAFREHANQRREPRRITGLGTWWQPSDLAGTFPRTINTLEFRFYPTTTDAANLVVPDLAQAPLLTIPPTPLLVNSGAAFNSVTISLPSAASVTTNGDFALCGVYPGGAHESLPGFFGLLPSASNQTFGMPQSYYGFAYATGAITHFGLGGARSSIWYTEDGATLSVRGNWAVSNTDHQNGHQRSAWGDASYFSPLASPSWPGWADSRNPTRLSLDVNAAGRDGDLVLWLFNFGRQYPIGFQFLGHTFEIDPTDPNLALFTRFGGPVGNGRFTLDLPLLGAADPAAAGTFIGFEAILVSPTLQFTDSTPSVWIRN
jgi:hypothetical protein